MNMRRVFTRSSILIGSFILILIVLFFINKAYAKCDDPHLLNEETGQCEYLASTCNEGEEQAVINGNNYCLYNPKGFLDSSIVKLLFLILSIIWIVVLILFIVSSSKKEKPTKSLEKFKKEDFVNKDRAETLWCVRFSKKHGYPLTEEEYKKSAFDFTESDTWQASNKEHFWMYQVEVTEGSRYGIYTGIESLSRGENWILNGMGKLRRCLFDSFKIARWRPLYTADTPQERAMEALMLHKPEMAMERQADIALQPEQSITPEQQDEIESNILERVPRERAAKKRFRRLPR